MRDAVKEVSKRTKNDGMLDSYYIETGKRTFMWVGVFESEQHLIDSRPALIANLDMMRHLLEEITPELGVTDPASGPVFHVR
jgi:hypothetical protein